MLSLSQNPDRGEEQLIDHHGQGADVVDLFAEGGHGEVFPTVIGVIFRVVLQEAILHAGQLKCLTVEHPSLI